MALLFDRGTGIKTLGLYRIGGVNSKVQKLMTTVFCKLHFTNHHTLNEALELSEVRSLSFMCVLLLHMSHFSWQT